MIEIVSNTISIILAASIGAKQRRNDLFNSIVPELILLRERGAAAGPRSGGAGGIFKKKKKNRVLALYAENRVRLKLGDYLCAVGSCK